MPNTSQIVDNTYEDFTDELSSSFIYSYSKQVFDPIKSKINTGSENLDEAIESAISTFEAGVRIQAMIIAQKFLYEKIIKLGEVYFSYIVAGSLVQGAKSKLKRALEKAKTKSLRGRALKGFLSMFDFSKSDRVSQAQLANDMFREHNQTFLQEKTNHIKHKQNLINQAFQTENIQTNKKMQLYMHKSRTGTWKNTTNDKKLYESIVGKLQTGVTWSKLYKQLNQFSEYTLTAEKEIVNFSRVLLDNLTAMQYEKVK